MTALRRLSAPAPSDQTLLRTPPSLRGIGGDYETIISIRGVGLHRPAMLSHERFAEEARVLAAEIVTHSGVICAIDYD